MTTKHFKSKDGEHDKRVLVTIKAPIQQPKRGDVIPETVIAVYDDNSALLDVAPVERSVAKMKLPSSQMNHMVHVFHAPLEEMIEKPSVARLKRNLAIEKRILVQPKLETSLPPVNLKRWRRSCCRVRGNVSLKVTLPNGKVQQRPLCNARIVICEVDASIPWIIRFLPYHLIYRLRDEWLEAIQSSKRSLVTSPALQAMHDGLHLNMIQEFPSNVEVRNVLTQLKKGVDVESIRDRLIKNIELLRPYWCYFDWLRSFYNVDCIKTVDLDEDGNFDTEIYYPCYGDHPDLYFKVEQGCQPDGWITIYAPPVHCNTYWDYCCGNPVHIQVTDTRAAPGRSSTSCVWSYIPGEPSSIGSWQLLSHDSGVFVVHAAVMHTGKVLMFSGTAERNLPTESRVWDPETDTMTSQDFDDDLFCCGHAVMYDGRVLVNGGAIPGQGRGIKSTHIFNPVTETWTKVRDMNHARWYPTTLALPNGKIITFSGRDENGQVVPQIEVYNPSTNIWADLPASANKTLDIYPSVHLMPDGKILYTGTRWSGGQTWTAIPPSALLDLVTNTWIDVDNHMLPNRTEGFSVLLPPLESLRMVHEHGEDHPIPHKPIPTLSRVLVVGGPGDENPPGNSKSAEILDMAEETPAWRRISDMSFQRNNVNGVILPDGNILFCTGIEGYKWGPNTPTLDAEIFDSQLETWTTVAAMQIPRQYHSISLLLPDGRVLNTGSVGVGPNGNVMSMELYSPAYLFRGPRPRITSCPTSIGYNTGFTIETPDSCRIQWIAMIRSSSITHHTNTDQRYLSVKWRREGACILHLTSPANANIAPPGYYMLFVMDDCRIPSKARFVKLG